MKKRVNQAFGLNKVELLKIKEEDLKISNSVEGLDQRTKKPKKNNKMDAKQ